MAIRRLFFAFLLSATAAGSISCASGEPGKVIRIGYQKSGVFLLLRNEGTLEKKFAPLGYAIEWREFSYGSPILEALNAGSIDIGHSGDAPVIFAQAAGVPFVYIAATDESPESAGVVVHKNSPIQNFAELRGKTIAFAKGSSSHHLLAQLLARAGLTFSDIKSAYLQPPDARAAFESGSIDAWAIWDPFFAAAELEGDGRVIATGAGFNGHREYYFARKEFLAAHPEILTPLLSALVEIGVKAKQDPKGTADFLAVKLGISSAVMERSEYRKQRYNARPLDPGIIQEQQEAANTFLRLGLIPRRIKISENVYNGPQ
jgi:sulfonate transport system substrate-binding protein